MLSNWFWASTFSWATECWDFYETEGGVCSFSPALQAPSCFQTFLGSCLAAWIKWKTQIVFFLLREREMNPRRAGRKIENRGGVFGELFWWFGCYSLIWVGGNKLFTWSNWNKMLWACIVHNHQFQCFFRENHEECWAIITDFHLCSAGTDCGPCWRWLVDSHRTEHTKDLI